MDTASIHQFYQTPLGQNLASSLSHSLKDFHRDNYKNPLTVGYISPYKNLLKEHMSFVPASQGCTYDTNHGIVVDEASWPLCDESTDYIFAIHTLEYVINPEKLLSEIWRVLAIDGICDIVVPNRQGLWAHYSHTPCGLGNSYTIGQLAHILETHGFSIFQKKHAVFFPPFNIACRILVKRICESMEHIGFQEFGGFCIIRAVKKLSFPLLLRSSYIKQGFGLQPKWMIPS